MRGSMWVLVLTCVVIAFVLAGAQAAPSPAPPAGGVLTKVAAQAAPKETPSASASATPNERITTLERENVVLREDLGKARLDVRTQLEAAGKRQAEAVARLQKQLDEANAKLEAERQKNAKRNRNLWYAVGALALGIALSN